MESLNFTSLETDLYNAINRYNAAQLAFWDLCDQLEVLRSSNCKFVCGYDLGISNACESLSDYFGYAPESNDEIEDDLSCDFLGGNNDV